MAGTLPHRSTGTGHFQFVRGAAGVELAGLLGSSGNGCGTVAYKGDGTVGINGSDIRILGSPGNVHFVRVGEGRGDKTVPVCPGNLDRVVGNALEFELGICQFDEGGLIYIERNGLLGPLITGEAGVAGIILENPVGGLYIDNPVLKADAP